MLLDDGLTEHILVKLCSRWNPALDDIVRKDEKYEDMRNNIEIWMRHKDESEIKIANVITKPTIQEILSPTYEIGTEKKTSLIYPNHLKSRNSGHSKTCLKPNVGKVKKCKKDILIKKEIILCQPCDSSNAEDDNYITDEESQDKKYIPVEFVMYQ